MTVDYATANGSADAGTDYTATNSTLTFNPSEVSKTFTVGILADTIHEHNETFIVTLSGPTNATVNDMMGEFTITDDDIAPTMTLG